MRTRHRLRTLVAGAALAPAVAACSSSGSGTTEKGSDLKGTISVMTWASGAVTSAWKKIPGGDA